MNATQQLLTGWVKSAGRGEQVLKLLQRLPVNKLETAMPATQASSLKEFAHLPNPLEKPNVLPMSAAGQLRADWQPPLTRDTDGTRWNTFLTTGKPPGAQNGRTAPWLNQLQRGALARQVWQLRKTAATAPSSLGSTGMSMMPGMGSSMGIGSAPPMASMMNQMQNSMQQNPVEAASMNPGSAPGGMLARWASSAKQPLASMLNSWKTQQNSMRGRAMF